MNRTVPAYNRLDPAIEARVEELLGQMTLEEKVGQMVQLNPWAGVDLDAMIRAGDVGSTLSVLDVHDINRLQHIAVEESRLGIPLLIGNDIIHGYRTTFPIPLAEACTWDPDLLEQTARAAADEASACGTTWIFAPMVDIARDPRWGRIAEGAGEDVYLGSAVAAARVRGFQADDLTSGRLIVACPKHYVAYGGAEAGRDYNTVDVSERTLREVYLPPFKAAFDAGAGSTMCSFNEIGGVPASANEFTLRTVLRDEWEWPGVVLSDYNSVGELIPHGIAADLKDAARLGALGGVDIDMMAHAYDPHLADLVREGAVSEQLIDDAARRVLRLKLQLGLFEQPYADESLPEKVLLRDDHRVLALEAARKSMVLLKNDGGLLPLQAGAQRVAVIGPLADDKEAPLGCWHGPGQSEDVETVLQGIRTYLQDGSKLTHVKGCAVEGDEGVDIEGAVAAAREADVVIAVLGESDRQSGEANSRSHITLPGHQQELLDALYATGKPIAVVLMNGRPLAIPRMVEQAAAILEAWHCGIRQGQAVADILFGAVNPSGKLAVSFPWSEGQIPIYYSRKNTGRPPEGPGTTQFSDPYRSVYLDAPTTPLFPFGYGLSYAQFSYSDLKVETPQVGLDGTLAVSATVRNSGKVAGDEVVQLYVHDKVASVTRPVKELKGFKRVTLQPGEAQTVRFEVKVQDLGFIGLDMKYTVEPGDFQVWLGPSSAEGLEGEFRVG